MTVPFGGRANHYGQKKNSFRQWWVVLVVLLAQAAADLPAVPVRHLYTTSYGVPDIGAQIGVTALGHTVFAWVDQSPDHSRAARLGFVSSEGETTDVVVVAVNSNQMVTIAFSANQASTTYLYMYAISDQQYTLPSANPAQICAFMATTSAIPTDHHCFTKGVLPPLMDCSIFAESVATIAFWTSDYSPSPTPEIRWTVGHFTSRNSFALLPIGTRLATKQVIVSVNPSGSSMVIFTSGDPSNPGNPIATTLSMALFTIDWNGQDYQIDNIRIYILETCTEGYQAVQGAVDTLNVATVTYFCPQYNLIAFSQSQSDVGNGFFSVPLGLVTNVSTIFDLKPTFTISTSATLPTGGLYYTRNGAVVLQGYQSGQFVDSQSVLSRGTGGSFSINSQSQIMMAWNRDNLVEGVVNCALRLLYQSSGKYTLPVVGPAYEAKTAISPACQGYIFVTNATGTSLFTVTGLNSSARHFAPGIVVALFALLSMYITL